MPTYKVTKAGGTDVRSQPNSGASVITHFDKDKKFEGQTTVPASGFVEVLSEVPNKPADGKAYVDFFHAQSDEAQPIPDPMPIPKEPGFLIGVTDAARRFGPERNYLMAAAYFRSKNLTDIGTKDSPRVGPFQFTADEWKSAISGVAKDLELNERDRYIWAYQPVVAALVAADHARSLANQIKRNANAYELHFSQRFGDGAAKILDGDRSRKCADAIEGAPVDGSYAAELKKGTQTVKEVLDQLRDGLIEGLAKALETIDTMPPDVRFFRASEMEAPWLTVAMEEKALNIAELPGDAHNPRIVRYHKAAGINNAADELPWCASFVTFCMKECGVPAVVASVPTNGPAGTAAWKTWGEKLADISEGAIDAETMKSIPIGAVVILEGAPEHIGFLVGHGENGIIRILGGNQGDQLRVDDYKVDKVRAVRWFDIGVDASVVRGGPLEITPEVFAKIFPDCGSPKLWASVVSAAWQRFGITSRHARAGFLGITGAETGYRGVMREDLHYNLPRAKKVFLKARQQPMECQKRLDISEEAFGNWIYASLVGNGDESSGDGFKFRGGGIIQLTFRANYADCAKAIGEPALLQDTDRIIEPKISALAAAWFIVDHVGILGELNKDDVGAYLTAALKVGKPADDNAEKRRINIRQAALDNL